MTKPIAIRLQDETGAIHRWTITHETGVGWQFRDHEGYSRVSEGNWRDLVAKFQRVAANYGLTLISELS